MIMGNSLLTKLRGGLSRTRNSISSLLKDVFSGKETIDSDTLENIEEVLISADVGVKATGRIIDTLTAKIKSGSCGKTTDCFRAALKDIVKEIIGKQVSGAKYISADGPKMMLLVGVNGSGKTTTAAKIAHRLKKDGKKVLICAADTFRAAAVDQLEVWAERAGVDIVKHNEGANPSAVVFDAVSAAKSRGTDWVIVDTAGRLHTRKNLMEELDKIRRVASSNLEGAPHETFLILDATTGQNGLAQAKMFAEHTPVSGLVLTKLDGTAKGGIVIGISEEINIPVKYIGVGEGIEDMLDFDASDFTEALFSE